ncbi:histidine phosphatase family protein [Ktedonosporobacter rubrisoli]|uniref:Histidine phosphatase family protein n=1 Tax=Ktedonosporobacter rubrisoli TaxID=2509675 RepID=A0A4P6JNU1_KTERU|nr:histidine phosphatase family protein [Ktedonosporobacter rubrisoli]QBD76915.1 histidine phosphatase family protein [Ktedonosporobacter rubrisoli]
MTHLYFIRHGDYLEDVMQGTYQDLGLSSDGIGQMERLRDRLYKTGEIKADVFISSPMRRAKESAGILAPAFNLPITFDKGLEEWTCDDGTMPPDEFSALWRQVTEEQKPFYRFMEGYETWVEFSGRVHAALNRLLQEHKGATIVLLSHGGVIAASFSYFFGLSTAIPARVSLSAKHASITHWSQAENSHSWTLEYFNDHHHLLPAL